jgi:broad specificity phosphatase PhoE
MISYSFADSNPLDTETRSRRGDLALLEAIVNPLDLATIQFKNSYAAIRHGEAISNLKHKLNSRIAPDEATLSVLTEVGKSSLASLAQNLGVLTAPLILHSPLARTRESAEVLSSQPISPLSACERQECPDLIERQYGELDGEDEVRWLEVRQNDLLLAETGYLGGESLVAFFKRLARVVLSCEDRYTGRDILLITHCDAIQALQMMFKSNQTLIRAHYSTMEQTSTGGYVQLHEKIVSTS